MFERDDFPKDDPVRQKLVEAERNWRHMLLETVKEAVDRAELKADLDVDQFVWEMSGIYLSHHVSHRFLKDSKATQRAIKAFERLLEHSAPGDAKRSDAASEPVQPQDGHRRALSSHAKIAFA